MWYCSQCGKQNQGNFCSSCGAPQPKGEENHGAMELLAEKEKTEDTMIQGEAAVEAEDTQAAEAGPPLGDTLGSVAAAGSAAALFRKHSREQLVAAESYRGATEDAPETEDTVIVEAEPLEEVTEVPEDSLADSVDGDEETVVLPAEVIDEPSLSPQAAKERTSILAPLLQRLKTRKGLTAVIVTLLVLLTAAVTLLVVVLQQKGEEQQLPESTGIYYYVSGVEQYASLYEDNSVKSKELVRLSNGDPVEFLYKVNYKFVYVLDHGSGLYGYMLSDELVDDIDAVDYENQNNQYDEEKSLGYYYVTKTEKGLTLWENNDGSGTVKATLKNGYKVSLLEETTDRYWYVFDYHSAERGYVRVAYLTDDEDKVVGVYKEPSNKTVIGDYYISGVSSYLSLRSEPTSGASLRGRLENGAKVGLIQKTTGSYWYVYAYSLDKYGYVTASYLTTEDPNKKEEETGSTDQPVSDPSAYTQYTVTGTENYLPVRSAGDINAGEVGGIHNGDTVNVINQSDSGYWYVYVPTLGQYGYVLGQYLTK